MQGNSRTILNLLSEGSLRVINGQSILKSQRDFVSKTTNMDSLGGRLRYLTNEYLASNDFIKGSECIMQAIYYLDQKVNGTKVDLYTLWISLSEEEKQKLNYEVFGKYRELYERRSLTRDGKIKVSDMSQPMNEKNTDIKLRSNISLTKLFNNKNYPTMLPDTDFLRKFSVGIVKYFMKEYLFTGKLADVQREKEANDIFNTIRSISDQDDDRFNKLASSNYLKENHLTI